MASTRFLSTRHNIQETEIRFHTSRWVDSLRSAESQDLNTQHQRWAANRDFTLAIDSKGSLKCQSLPDSCPPARPLELGPDKAHVLGALSAYREGDDNPTIAALAWREIWSEINKHLQENVYMGILRVSPLDYVYNLAIRNERFAQVCNASPVVAYMALGAYRHHLGLEPRDAILEIDKNFESELFTLLGSPLKDVIKELQTWQRKPPFNPSKGFLRWAKSIPSCENMGELAFSEILSGMIEVGDLIDVNVIANLHGAAEWETLHALGAHLGDFVLDFMHDPKGIVREVEGLGGAGILANIGDYHAINSRQVSLSALIEASNAWHANNNRGVNISLDSIDSFFPDPKVAFFESDNYVGIFLNTPRALVTEAREMHHCVDSYWKYCMRGDSIIYSVKSKSTPLRYTLEVDSHYYLAQIRGFANDEVDSQTYTEIEFILGRALKRHKEKNNLVQI